MWLSAIKLYYYLFVILEPSNSVSHVDRFMPIGDITKSEFGKVIQLWEEG